MGSQNYEIIDKFQKNLLIKCSICGRIDIVNCDDIQNYSCSTCNKFKVKNIDKDSDELSRIIDATSKDESCGKQSLNKKYFRDSIPNGVNISQAVNTVKNRYTIIGIIYQLKLSKYNSNQYIQVDYIVGKCNNCGLIKLIQLDKDGAVCSQYCNRCKFGYNDTNNKKALDTWNNLKNLISDITERAESKTHVKDSYNTKLLEKQRKELNRARKDKSEHEIKIITPRVSDKIQKAFDKVKELNPDFNIEGFNVSGAEYTVKCSCNKCGNDISIASSLKKKKIECEGCKKLRTNPNYRGVYLKNNTNNCKNSLVITRDFGRKVEVSCVICSAKYVVNKYDWMYGNIYCDKDHDVLDATVICDSCKNYVVLKTSEIIKYKGDGTDSIICNCCKNPVIYISDKGIKEPLTYGSIISDMNGMDSKITRSKNFGLAVRELKSTTSTINNLCRSNQVLYVDKNGERYYNCRCLEHNQNMILTDNEIDNFNHSQCEDIRNIIINDEMLCAVSIK